MRHKWKSNTTKTQGKCERCGVKTRFSKRRGKKDKTKFVSVPQWSTDGKSWTEGEPPACQAKAAA